MRNPTYRDRLSLLAVPALCLLAALLPGQLLAQALGDQPERKSPFSTITVIGDSLSDTGRLFAAIGIPPPPYFNGRSSNGPLWVEYLAPNLRLAYDPLDNLSWAGATTGRLNVWGTGLPGMLDELDEFLAPLPHRADPRALHVVQGGANDLIRIFVGGADPSVVIPEAVGNVVRIVATLRARGAQDIVVFDVPDLGLTPRARAAGPAVAAGATLLSATFNTLLGQALDTLGFPVVRVNTFALLNAITAQPAAFGFTDVTHEGILDPIHADTYLFWDDVHPTTRGHRAIADAALGALEDAGLLKQLLKHP